MDFSDSEQFADFSVYGLGLHMQLFRECDGIVASLVGRPLFDFFWQETYSPQTYVTATEERTFFFLLQSAEALNIEEVSWAIICAACTTLHLPNIYVMKWVRSKKKAEKRTLCDNKLSTRKVRTLQSTSVHSDTDSIPTC